MYTVYYNARDDALTWDLALDLVHRAEDSLCLGDRPTWCLVTQGYALAAKLLFLLLESTGHGNRGGLILRSAIESCYFNNPLLLVI